MWGSAILGAIDCQDWYWPMQAPGDTWMNDEGMQGAGSCGLEWMVGGDLFKQINSHKRA